MVKAARGESMVLSSASANQSTTQGLERRALTHAKTEGLTTIWRENKTAK